MKRTFNIFLLLEDVKSQWEFFPVEIFFFFFSRDEKMFSILLKKYSDIRFALKGALEASVGIILLAQPSVRPGWVSVPLETLNHIMG